MEFIGHSGSVLCCCVFKTFIISAGYDKVIRVWDAEHGTIIESLNGHEHIISSIDIFQHPNFCGSDENGHQKHSQPIIISGSWDRSVCVWKLPTIKAHPLISNMKSHKHEIITVNKSEEKCKWLKFKMEGHKNRIKCVRAVQPQQHPHQNAAISPPDGVNYCASGSDDGIIIVWNIDTGTQHLALYGHTHFILQLAVYLDVEQDSVRNGTESGGRFRLVSHSSDRTLRVWCLSLGEQISLLDLSGSDIVSVEMSSSGIVDDNHGGDGPVLGDKLQGIAFNDSFLSTADQQSQKTPATLTNSNSYANSSHHWSGMGSVVMSRQNSSLSVDSAAGRAATDIFSMAIVTLTEDTVQAMTAGQLGLNHTTEHYQDNSDQQHATQSWRPVLVVSDKCSNLLLYSLPYHTKTNTDSSASDSSRHRQALSLLYSVNSVNVTANVTARSAHSAHSSNDDTPIVIPPYVVSIAATTALDTALWAQSAIHMQNAKMKSLLASSSGNSSVSSNSGSGSDTRNNSVSRVLDGCFITYVTDRGFVGYVDLLQTAQSSGRSGTYDLSQAVPLKSPSTNKVVSVNKHKSNPNSSSVNGSMPPAVTYNLIAVSSVAHDPSAVGVSPHRNNLHNSTGSSYIAVCGDDGTLLVRKFNLHETADAHRNSNRSVVTPAIKLPDITSPQPPNSKQKVSGGNNKRSGADSRIVDPDDSGVTTSQQRHLLKNYQKLVYDGADPLLLDDSSSGARPRNFNGDEDSNCSNMLTSSADNSGSGATFWQSIVGDAQFSFARIKFNAKDKKAAGGGAAGGGSGMNSGANSARRNHPNGSNSNSGGSAAASAANRNGRPQRGAQQPTTTQNAHQTRNNKNATNRRPYDLATNNTASTTTVAQLMQQNNQSIQNTGSANNSRVLLSPLPGLSALSALQTQSHPTLSAQTAGAGATGDGDYVTSLLLSHLPPKKTMNHLYDVNGGSVGGNNGRGNTNRGSTNSRQRGVGSVGRRLLMPLFS